MTVLVRADCPACVSAAADVRRICTALGVEWSTCDVDAHPELRAEYGDRIPVILVDGREHGFWRVQEERLRRSLSG